VRAYREILRLPGALAFCLAALLARSGGAMMGIGQVLMVSALYGNYTAAGGLAAANGAAWAVGNAILSSRVDHLGQRRVMLPCCVLSAATLALVVVLALCRAPIWTLFPAAAVSGFLGGSPSALVRARWAHATRNAAELHTAYALESTLDEIPFVFGPIIVTFLSTQVHPAAGLVLPVVLGLGGGFAFYSQRATEPPATPRAPRDPSAAVPPAWQRLKALVGQLIFFIPGVGPIVAVTVLVGAFFGGIDISVVAATTDWDVRAQTGLILAFFSCGSALAGFGYGSRAWRSPLTARFVVLQVAMLAAGATLLAASNVPLLCLAGFLIGATIAPSLVNTNSLITRTVPHERLTEGLAWTGTALGLGTSLGSSVIGRVIDVAGYHASFQTTVGFAAGSAAIAVASLGVLRKALQPR
jgi:MFS family permease